MFPVVELRLPEGVKAIRGTFGLTQVQFASRCGLSRQAVIELEKRPGTPPPASPHQDWKAFWFLRWICAHRHFRTDVLTS